MSRPPSANKFEWRDVTASAEIVGDVGERDFEDEGRDCKGVGGGGGEGLELKVESVDWSVGKAANCIPPRRLDEFSYCKKNPPRKSCHRRRCT